MYINNYDYSKIIEFFKKYNTFKNNNIKILYR